MSIERLSFRLNLGAFGSHIQYARHQMWQNIVVAIDDIRFQHSLWHLVKNLLIANICDS
ncbi:hypothetical protein D3C85_1862840 [compost metagenome]